SGRVQFSAARSAVVFQHCIRCVQDLVTHLPQAQAKVHVAESHGQLLVETLGAIEYLTAKHHASRRDRQRLTYARSGHTKLKWCASVSHADAFVLQFAAGKYQAATNRAHFRKLT